MKNFKTCRHHTYQEFKVTTLNKIVTAVEQPQLVSNLEISTKNWHHISWTEKLIITSLLVRHFQGCCKSFKTFWQMELYYLCIFSNSQKNLQFSHTGRSSQVFEQWIFFAQSRKLNEILFKRLHALPFKNLLVGGLNHDGIHA